MLVRLVKEAEGSDGVLPVGTTIEHPDAWVHCLPGHLNSDPIAEPVDDEAKDRVAKEQAKRGIKLRELAAIVKRPGQTADAKQFNKELAVAHSEELAELR